MKENPNLYVIGAGAMGSLFGNLIVDYALGRDSEALSMLLAQQAPSYLPPRPLLDIGVRSRLAWQRFQGRHEA